MKNLLKKHAGLSLAVLITGGAGSALAQTQDLTIWDFNTGTSGIGVEWGTGSLTVDSSVAGPNDTGSLLVTVDFSGSSDTPAADYLCMAGGNPWYQPKFVDLSLYKSIDFDIKYDPTSDITIAEFNDLSTWPATLTNSFGENVFQSWAGAGYLAGSIGGLEFDGTGSYSQDGPFLYNTNIPAAAADGWVHLSLPINPTLANVAAINGLFIHKWINQNWGIQNDAIARFWIDNVVLKGTAGPPPPPKLSVPTTPVQGLNVFSSTEGNSFYDRQEAELRQGSGLSWVGQATTANPVSYSFTIVGYPNSQNCEAYMFLVPNPANSESAPDWNETNCAVVEIQGGPANATMSFQYKVNEPGNNQMYTGAGNYTNAPGSWDGVAANHLENGTLATVNNNSVLGTWTLKFTSNTNGTLIAPDGASTNFVFPVYNVGYFAEQNATGFNIYLGMQANQADGMNQAVVYSSIVISNTASPYAENFLADTTLDTVNTWNTSVAGGPQGVLIVPPGAADWVMWTLPDTGFSLEVGTNLSNYATWTSPSIGPMVPLYGLEAQLVASSELPAGGTAFFNLIKRTFTQLQVLLPGETNAPGTATGKIGTPTPESVYGLFPVTVNACDATWHILSSYDTVNLTSATDPTGSTSTGTGSPLVGGTVQIQWYFDTAGSQTVTASDTTTTTILPNTSSSVTVQ